MWLQWKLIGCDNLHRSEALQFFRRWRCERREKDMDGHEEESWINDFQLHFSGNSSTATPAKSHIVLEIFGFWSQPLVNVKLRIREAIRFWILYRAKQDGHVVMVSNTLTLCYVYRMEAPLGWPW
ncbi:unnamed protein product [Brassica rapa subsp. trilocularis]